MKRFYKDVTVGQAGDGWQVMLDGRGIKTQGGRPQVVPSTVLAEALAAEWAQQGEKIEPISFIFRDMADYAIDIVPEQREDLIAKLLGYAETDTLCYRADPDEPLWHRQRAVWDPLLSALEERESVALNRVSGIIHKPQSKETLEGLKRPLTAFGPFHLSALEQVTSLAASLCIGLAALDADANGEALWDAANLEEDWQVEQWGADEEAASRRAKRKGEFLKAIEFARLASA